MRTTKITHVIFDVDGTLIDESGVLVAQAQAVGWKFGDSIEEMQKVVNAFFAANDKAERLKEAGNTAPKGDILWYMTEIGAALGIPVSADEKRQLATAWKEAFQASLGIPQLFPDVVACLETLQQAGKTLMVASGGSLESRERILSDTGIRSYFSHVFSSQHIGFQKQDVRFWETVLHEIDASPDCIAVVGNQINDDIVNPKAFGMTTVLVERLEVLSKYFSTDVVAPNYVISDMKKLTAIL